MIKKRDDIKRCLKMKIKKRDDKKRCLKMKIKKGDWERLKMIKDGKKRCKIKITKDDLNKTSTFHLINQFLTLFKTSVDFRIF